ncbi:MAG: carboxypeptidase-like regulatory domain-containing protein [Phycisphaerae bacterium]
MMLQVRTDADGLAEALWRMGFDAGCGNNRIDVTSTSIAGTTFFCASAAHAPPAQINIGTGNNQRAEASGPAPEPLRVWVNDRCNGVPDVPVVFTVTRGGGRVNDRTSTVVTTSDTGHAEVVLTLGSEPGNNVVEATFPGNPTSTARFTVFGIVRDEAQATSFSGLVLDNGDNPIQGATCTLTVEGTSLPSLVTDIDGRFQFDDVPGSGPAGLHVDGLTAFHVGGAGGRKLAPGSFPVLHFETVIVPHAENSLPTPALLPELNPNNARQFDNTQDVELTVEGIAGLRMIVKAGSMTRANGTVPTPADPAIISLNQVDVDKIPMPMPDGAAPPFSWTLQPGGAHFDPPVQIIYPNMSGLPAGSIAYFLSFNHTTMRFEIVATGQVTDDGSQIVSDPGAGISTGGWGCNCPPYSVTGDCCDCDDCEACVDGECVSSCGSDGETCCGGSCCDLADCEICDGGACANICDQLDGCFVCVDGACQNNCFPELCQECENGECVSMCDEANCQVCLNGECGFLCDEDQCQECVDGNCEFACDPACESCAGGGLCDSDCGTDCEECADGSCVSILLTCQICQEGQPVNNCPAGPCCFVAPGEGICCDTQNQCEACTGGECLSVLLPCQVCQNGQPVDECPPCEVCLDDTCVSVLLPCQSCENGAPVDDCAPCEVCLDETCESVLLACETCQGGVPVDNCSGSACCGGLPGQGVCCNPNEICVDGGCVNP